MKPRHDAVVVGSGPNGLAAGITLARAGLSVLLIEANTTVGGGVRSAALTRPGFVHDLCSSIHPLAVASPFFQSLDLAKHGLVWIHPGLPLAHPLDGGQAAALDRSLSVTARDLGADGEAYSALMEQFVSCSAPLLDEILQPLLHVPNHPVLLAFFGFAGLQSAAGLARRRFQTPAARALFAGLAAHSFLPLEQTASAAIGLVLGSLAHTAGWPFPQGGAQKIADALAACFVDLGGEIETGRHIKQFDELPPARLVMLDVSAQQLLTLAGHRLPADYISALNRFRYGPGVFKIDYALSAPIPWTADACRRAGTVHVGGTMEEIAAAEKTVTAGEHPGRPFVLVAQHSLFDTTRAPANQHTAWAYCHVPNGSIRDMTQAIEAQIERFAPGFRDCILMRHTRDCAALSEANANLIGGDINGGLASLRQTIMRPVFSANPYRTPIPGVYLCSASTPPGGGVHGMCGYHAACAALRALS